MEQLEKRVPQTQVREVRNTTVADIFSQGNHFVGTVKLLRTYLDGAEEIKEYTLFHCSAGSEDSCSRMVSAYLSRS